MRRTSVVLGSIVVLVSALSLGDPASAISATTRIVSVGTNGAAANADSGRSGSSQSFDGGTVAFVSEGANLADTLPKPGPVPRTGPSRVGGVFPTAGADQVYVRYPFLGRTVAASIGFDLSPANGPSGHPSVSADGRFVAFESTATNLTPCATDGTKAIFVRDLLLHLTRIASIPDGQIDACEAAMPDGENRAPSISGDGRYVAFESDATNLLGGDTNGVSDVYVKDMLTGAVTRVSFATLCNPSCFDMEPDGASTQPSISGDGSSVAFTTEAENLPDGSVGAPAQVYVRYVADAQSMEKVSVGTIAPDYNDGESSHPAIDYYGNEVAFQSDDTTLIASDTNGVTDVFVRRRAEQKTDRVSEYLEGIEAGSPSRSPSVSAYGSSVAFESDVTDLEPGVSAVTTTVYRADLDYNQSPIVVGVYDKAINDFSAPADAAVTLPSLSGDTRSTLFTTQADNIDPNAVDGTFQVFAHYAGPSCANGSSEDGTVSAPVHDTVEPVAGGVEPDAAVAVHDLNCDVVRALGL